MGLKETNEVRMRGVIPARNAEPIPVGKIPDLATQVVKQSSASGATATIHTVTAAKTLYLNTVIFSIYNVQTNVATLWMGVTNDSDTVQYYFFYTSVTSKEPFAVPATFFPPLEIPAGWKVKVYSNVSNAIAYGFLHGYEV